MKTKALLLGITIIMFGCETPDHLIYEEIEKCDCTWITKEVNLVDKKKPTIFTFQQVTGIACSIIEQYPMTYIDGDYEKTVSIECDGDIKLDIP